MFHCNSVGVMLIVYLLSLSLVVLAGKTLANSCKLSDNLYNL